jgi:hypothetical protein
MVAVFEVGVDHLRDSGALEQEPVIAALGFAAAIVEHKPALFEKCIKRIDGVVAFWE